MTNRKPTFGTALRMIDLLLALDQRRYSWPVDEAAEELEVDPRTIKRYVEALGTRLVTEDGRPAVEIKHRGRQPCIVVNRPVLTLEPGVYDYAAMHLAKGVLEMFVPDSLMHESLERLTRDLAGAVQNHTPGRSGSIERIPQKFIVENLPGDETVDSEVLSDVVSALVLERRLEISLRSCPDEAVLVEPLSLRINRQGLSLEMRRADCTGRAFMVALGDIVDARLRERVEPA